MSVSQVLPFSTARVENPIHAEPITRARSESIDALRGFVMVLMALDHARDFFTTSGINPTDLAFVSAPLFITRWLTHLCAPVFLFLAGVGAYLSSAKKSRSELQLFLVKRGLWMILLELTLIRLGWQFDLNYGLTQLQVFWAIGWSMIFLAALIRLPTGVIAAIGAVLVLGHNALDGVKAADLGAWGPLWQILHEPGTLYQSDSTRIEVLYPLVPWLGVIALGYGFGEVWRLYADRRVRMAAVLGGTLWLTFFLIRIVNLYGNPTPWRIYGDSLTTVLSFINVEKYPPSLQYLLVTLGMALMLLALLERGLAAKTPGLVVFGRVPFFYYVLHLFALHAMALMFALIQYGGSLPSWELQTTAPAGWGYPLVVVYLVWMAVVAMLYRPCAWFATLKRTLGHPALSYL